MGEINKKEPTEQGHVVEMLQGFAARLLAVQQMVRTGEAVGGEAMRGLEAAIVRLEGSIGNREAKEVKKKLYATIVEEFQDIFVGVGARKFETLLELDRKDSTRNLVTLHLKQRLLEGDRALVRLIDTYNSSPISGDEKTNTLVGYIHGTIYSDDDVRLWAGLDGQISWQAKGEAYNILKTIIPNIQTFKLG